MWEGMHFLKSVSVESWLLFDLCVCSWQSLFSRGVGCCCCCCWKLSVFSLLLINFHFKGNLVKHCKIYSWRSFFFKEVWRKSIFLWSNSRNQGLTRMLILLLQFGTVSFHSFPFPFKVEPKMSLGSLVYTIGIWCFPLFLFIAFTPYSAMQNLKHHNFLCHSSIAALHDS